LDFLANDQGVWKMEMNFIIGKLLSSGACAVYASAMAIWMAGEAVAPIRHVAQIVTSLP
jgi:hypothetical protein